MPQTWPEDRREAVCVWLRANGIDPNTVPLHDHQLRITERNGRRFIEYTEFVRDELTGNILADPDDRQPVTSEVSVQCLIEPKPSLGVPGGRP
ncbi:hypothetical protein ACWDVX_33945 [Streptomyces tendae]